MATKIRTSNISNTGVTSGSYTTANITVNDQGQVMLAASGISAGDPVMIAKNNMIANYTLPSGFNGLSIGPLTIASGVSVTIGSGQRWVIL